MTTETWGLGLGGTNLYLGKVDLDTGDVTDFKRKVLKDDFPGYNGAMDYVRSVVPKGSNIGVSASGDLSSKNPLLINYMANSPFQGQLDLEEHLSEHTNTLTLTGDVRGEVLAATKYYPTLKDKLTILATYSTGHGFDIATNGELTLPNSNEAGHGLEHRVPTEFSFYDGMPCGCVTNGGSHLSHIEAYVSGPSSANMARRFLKSREYEAFSKHSLALVALETFNQKPKKPEQTGSHKKENYDMSDLRDDQVRDTVFECLTGEMVYRLFNIRSYVDPQNSIRHVQEDAIKQSLHNMNALFSPDVILIKGSFAENEWSNVFRPAVNKIHDATLGGYNSRLLIKPLSDPHISVRGGALYNHMQSN